MESRKLPYLLIAPAAAIFALLFVAPFAYFFVISFWQVRLYKLRAEFTLANYARVGTDYLEVGLFTIGLALTVALLTTLLGFIYAYIVRFRAGRYGPLLLFIALVTLFGGYSSTRRSTTASPACLGPSCSTTACPSPCPPPISARA